MESQLPNGTNLSDIGLFGQGNVVACNVTCPSSHGDTFLGVSQAWRSQRRVLVFVILSVLGVVVCSIPSVAGEFKISKLSPMGGTIDALIFYGGCWLVGPAAALAFYFCILLPGIRGRTKKALSADANIIKCAIASFWGMLGNAGWCAVTAYCRKVSTCDSSVTMNVIAIVGCLLSEIIPSLLVVVFITKECRLRMKHCRVNEPLIQ